MTGPRIPLVHPHCRRGRLLLPFLAVTLLSLLACTSDQPTEPASPSLAVTTSAPAAKVLLLADVDGDPTDSLQASLTRAGFDVTLRPAPEYTWNGTNPALTGYAAVVHLNGATYFAALPLEAQTALTDFVQSGGGFVAAQLTGYEAALGQTTGMSDLVLQGFGGSVSEDCAGCTITYVTEPAQASHPVLAGLLSSFAINADYHNAGPQSPFATELSTVLMRVPSGGPAVLVRELGGGRVVNFSFGPNYDTGVLRTLLDPNVQHLYVNAVRWAARVPAAPPAKAPATITLTDPEPTFDGTIKGASATTDPVALSGVSLTYSQSGSLVAAPINAGVYQVRATLDNPNYEAPEATGTLTIHQALPVINWTAPASLPVGTPLGTTQLNATAAGVAGASLAGSFLYTPPAGTLLEAGPARLLSVQFTPSDPNYTGATKTVQIAVVANRFTFNGFFRPVSNLPMLNVVRAGRTIPLKFSVGEYQGMGILPGGSPTSSAVSCGARWSQRPMEETRETRRSGLYATGKEYTYVWKTNSSWAGTCRKVILTLADGTTHEARFRFLRSSNHETPDGNDRRDGNDRGEGHRGRDDHRGQHGRNEGDRGEKRDRR